MDSKVIFWAKLGDGRTNSISSTNLIEAKRRAQDIGATALFVYDVASRTSRKVF